MAVTRVVLGPLTEAQVLVVRVIWSSFQENRDWPIYQFVDDAVDDLGLRLDRVIPTFPKYRSVPYGPIWWQSMGHPQPTTKIGATVAGLIHLPEADAVVAEFVDVIRTVSLRWRSIPSKPESPRELSLRFGDLVGVLGGGDPVPEPLVRCIQRLLEHEPPSWGGVRSAPDERWTWEVGPAIRGFSQAANAEAYLRAVDELVDESPVPSGLSEPVASSQPRPHIAFDDSLWGHVADSVGAARWDQVVREAAVFLEDYLRRRSGLTPDHVGVELVTAVLHPNSGMMPLALAGGKSESEGWYLMARGLVLAVRNAVGHRLNVFSDEQSAMGALGTISLLLRQLARDYPTTSASGDVASQPQD